MVNRFNFAYVIISASFLLLLFVAPTLQTSFSFVTLFDVSLTANSNASVSVGDSITPTNTSLRFPVLQISSTIKNLTAPAGQVFSIGQTYEAEAVLAPHADKELVFDDKVASIVSTAEQFKSATLGVAVGACELQNLVDVYEELDALIVNDYLTSNVSLSFQLELSATLSEALEVKKGGSNGFSSGAGTFYYAISSEDLDVDDDDDDKVVVTLAAQDTTVKLNEHFESVRIGCHAPVSLSGVNASSIILIADKPKGDLYLTFHGLAGSAPAKFAFSVKTAPSDDGGSDDDDDGLKGWQIGLIVIGCVAFVLLVAFIVGGIIYWNKRRGYETLESSAFA